MLIIRHADLIKTNVISISNKRSVSFEDGVIFLAIVTLPGRNLLLTENLTASGNS